MAQVYAAPPQGGLFNIPDTLPQGLLYRYKKISNLSRQNLKVPPNNGQGDVWAGQKIIVTLPQNALIDLSTFTMDFKGYTQHNGSNNGATVGPLNYCQGRFFPRNTQSLIETMEIKIGGQTRQLINNYGYIYNILNDFTTGTDATNKNRIGQNADSSCKYYYSKSGVRRRCGFPLGVTTDPKTANDQDDYTIRNWLGFFQGSTSIIDTSMFGQIDLEITLAPSGVLMLGKKTDTTTITAITATNSEIGIDIQIADVKKALGLVWRICEAGNRVVFYEDGSYVENKSTKNTSPWSRRRGLASSRCAPRGNLERRRDGLFRGREAEPQ